MAEDLYNIDWSALPPEQHQTFERALKIAEDARNYQISGGRGGTLEAYQYLGAKGGLTPEQATVLSRFKAWKTGQQPAKGLPRAPDTEDEIYHRSQALYNSDDAEYKKGLNEAGKAQDLQRSQDNFFADITNRKALGDAYNAERAQRHAPVGPPLSAAGDEQVVAQNETTPIHLGAAATAPTPVSRVGAEPTDDERLADASLMLYEHLANTPYSNESVSAMSRGKKPVPYK